MWIDLSQSPLLHSASNEPEHSAHSRVLARVDLILEIREAEGEGERGEKWSLRGDGAVRESNLNR